MPGVPKFICTQMNLGATLLPYRAKVNGNFTPYSANSFSMRSTPSLVAAASPKAERRM